MDLLERDETLGALNDRFAEAAAGRGSLVLLGGEAGVGKTILLERFREFHRENARIFAGWCDALATPRPLGPLRDMSTAIGSDLSDLLDREGDRGVLFARFLAVIGEGRVPGLVTFEDVHWADDSTLDLLRYLGKRLAPARCLVVATYRDDEVGPRHRLRMLMGDLASSPSMRRLNISPLSEEAVAVLAEGTGLDPAALHRRTGGNPFFVTEILAAGGGGIPDSLRDAVMARAARLSRGAQGLLEEVAVIGLRAETWLVAAVSVEPATAIDECLGSGMLGSEPGALAFRHEMARETILTSIPPHRAVELNRLVLAALRQAPGGEADLARLVQHAEAAQDAEAVLEFAPLAAAQAASLMAHRQGAAQYARVLRFGDRLEPVVRADYLERQAAELEFIDELTEAIVARETALALRRELGQVLKVAENLRRLTGIYRFMGRRSEAEAAATEAITVLEAEPVGPELGWAYSSQSRLRMLDADVKGVIETGMPAIRLGRRFGDKELLAHAFDNIGTSRLSAGDERGLRQMQLSLKLALSIGAEHETARAYANLIAPAAWNRRMDLLDRYLPEALAYLAERDIDTLGLYIQSIEAFRLLCHGDWEGAELRALSVINRPIVSPYSRLTALSVLGRLRARRGNKAVFEPLDEALQLAEPNGEILRLGLVRAARAEAHWLAGDDAAAVAEVDAVIQLATERQHVGLLGELAYWRWRAGGEQATPEGAPKPFALEMEGRWAEAAMAWTEAECPYEAAQALINSDDPEDLRRAWTEFERLGGRPAADRTARRLRQMGARGLPRGPRATTRANPASLTDREMEILGFVAEGLRNADIAGRLHLSTKTVDHHVSAILGKLGVRSRTEAVRAAEVLGRGQEG